MCKEILVIGSKGFIGSHLLEALRKDDLVVFGCDVVADYLDAKYIQFDVADGGFEAIFSKHSFDCCVNCSGSASVPFSNEHPLSDFQLNVSNVFQMLDAIRKFSPDCKFIQLSSAAVYGNPTELPITENHPLRPVSVYGYNKKMAEEICLEFNQLYNIPVTISRVFSAFGQGLRKQLFWDLSNKLREEEIPVMFGTGHESRDFIHVYDLIHALRIIIEEGDTKCGIYNVASGEQILIKDAVNVFIQKFDKNRQVAFSGANRTGDPVVWKADITKLKNIGFKTSVEFGAGIKMYIEWLQNAK